MSLPKRTRVVSFVWAFLYLSCGSPNWIVADDSPTRLLAQPAISADHVAFVYDRDIWIADRDGKNPLRLTSHEGSEGNPCFSPDGTQIAYTAEYDGNLDVYLIPIQGGSPRRLTWHPTPDSVEGFTPDGKSVLFSSPRNVFTPRHQQLFTVSTEGGFPTQLPIPHGLRAAYSPDGTKIAYIPIAERFFQWKHYRGGTASRIWIYEIANQSVQQIRQPESRCNDTDPVWIGNTVYFRSDRQGEFNIFSYDPQSEAIKQLTHFEDFHVNRLEGGAGKLIFEQAGMLHTFDPQSVATTTLPIRIATDLADTRPRWVSGSEWIRDADISPSGARAVMEYRGEILTLPASKGEMRNLSETAGANERSPIWSPDGKRVAFFSDVSGEYRLHIKNQDGSGQVESYDIQGTGFYRDPQWSPDGTKISYSDNSWSLYVFDLAKKQATKVASAHHYAPADLNPVEHDWSPDSRWLAYTTDTPASLQQVFVFNVDEAKSYPITDGLSDVREPTFDRTGKYLYFVASTDAGPVKNWFDMSNNDMVSVGQIYLAVLSKNTMSPLKPESDEEVGSTTSEGAKPDDKEKGKTANSESAAAGAASSDGENRTRIDFEGLDQRIQSLGLPNAVYGNLSAGLDGSLFFVRRNIAIGGGEDAQAQSELAVYSFKKRKASSLLSGATGFKLSRDGKKLLYRVGNTLGIAGAEGKVDLGETRLAVDKIRVQIDPRAEWEQIYNEVWRINRDFFYDPNMHGADWKAMREKYRPFLASVANRGDLNRVLTWMCSELAVGHHRVGGGDERIKPSSVPGGLLGCDFKIENGRYRFARVLGGLNWNGDLRAPLTEPGVDVAPGEYLLAVEGVELTDRVDVYSRFENKADKATKITVGPNPDFNGSREVTVTPIADESALRNRAWVEGNLKRVTEATQGRVAYVYVPNTADLGHTYFKRYFFPQANREAIIVDERFNGGGQIADYYIDLMRRPFLSNWATRYGQDLRTPSAAIFGPKVMIIDETAGSGGDMLPWMFHKLQLGTLVGKRTWGGLVGILGFPVLMDGGQVTAPDLAIWTEDGFIVENVGVPPDIDVEQWPAEVATGKDPQLEKAIEVILKQLEASPAHTPVKPPYPNRVK